MFTKDYYIEQLKNLYDNNEYIKFEILTYLDRTEVLHTNLETISHERLDVIEDILSKDYIVTDLQVNFGTHTLDFQLKWIGD